MNIEITKHGENITEEGTISSADFLAQFENKDSLDVKLTANIAEVCSKKGCWMTMKLKSKSVRVKFKDYDFFVPMSLEGKNIYIKGKLTREKVSIKDSRHYLEDAGASKKEIAAVTRPSYEFHFTASGVKLVQ